METLLNAYFPSLALPGGIKKKIFFKEADYIPCSVLPGYCSSLFPEVWVEGLNGWISCPSSPDILHRVREVVRRLVGVLSEERSL